MAEPADSRRPNTTRRFVAKQLIRLVTCLSLCSATARADSTAPRREQAAQLLREGNIATAKGRIPEACRFFEQSLSLHRTLSALLHTARCHRAQGRLRVALSELTEAQSRALQDDQRQQAQFASEQARAIAAVLPTLRVVVPDRAIIPGLVIAVDDEELDVGGWNEARPIDPGVIVVVAKAPGRRPWKGGIRVSEGESAILEVPALAELPPNINQASVTFARTRPPFWDSTRTASALFIGVGASALSIGGVFGVDALRKRAASDQHCAGSECTDPDGVSLNEKGQASAARADIAFAAGGALVATGIVLWFVADDTDEDPTLIFNGQGTSLHPTLQPTAHGATAGVHATW